MAVSFKKAERKKVWLKVLLTGPSGSGKSYSALRIAKGIADQYDGKIAYLGTEGSRDEYYSDRFDYDLISLEPPFTIDKYVEVIDAAVENGYSTLIIDSMTAEWKWLNEVHDRMPGNSWSNWSKLKPKHRAFMDKILLSPIHVISTTRSRTEWSTEEENGKQKPKKIGLEAQADKDISYEYTISFQIDQSSHVATADKDNTGMFDGVYEVLTEEAGKKMWKWANSGNLPAETKSTPVYDTSIPPTSEEDDLKSIKSEIITLCVAKGGQKNETLMKTIKAFVPSGNPNAIKSLDTAKNCLEAVKALD